MKATHLSIVFLISLAVALLTNALMPNSDAFDGNSNDTKQLKVRITQLENKLAQLEKTKSATLLATADVNNVSRVDRTSPTIENAAPDALATEVTQAEEEQVLINTPVVNASTQRQQRLIGAGFTEQEANWVLEQESKIQLELLEQQHLARKRQAELAEENGTQTPNRFERFRERLGEDSFERYLEANGFPTKVNVNRVVDGSPGQNAGLLPGDQITHYDGRRIFNIRELNQQTIVGEQGQSVLVEVERNGQPVQVTIQRGPIGIVSGRGQFRRQGRR